MSGVNGIASMEDVLAVEALWLSQALPTSTYEMLCSGVAINPDAPALSFFLQVDDHDLATTWSYRELLRRIHQTANFFHGLGANKHTVIAYILPNLPETHCVIWGGQATGIICAINPLLEPAAMAELLQATGANILVTLAPFPGTDLWPKVHKALQSVSTLRDLVLINPADHVTGVKGLLAGLLQKREEYRLHGLKGASGAVPRGLAVHDFNRSIKTQDKVSLQSGRIIQPDDFSSYFCTGGTTGIPKLAMRRHRNEVANAWSAAQFLGDGVGSEKNVFCGLPLFHVNAVLVTGLLPFSKGAHVILGTPQGFRTKGVIERFWEIVDYHHINFFSGVPTLYAALLNIPVGSYCLDSLQYGLCGAAPMPPEVFRQFQERTGIKILEGYGLTEGTCVSSVNPPLGERRIGSIGLRVPGQQMKAVILDDTGNYLRDCNTGEVGALVISGPNVFSGYKLPEQDKGLWVFDLDGLRWLNTGDLCYQDSDGYFWLTGRKKELIIRGGHNIDPITIEEPLHRHPAIQVVAAVGRPDVHAGELPVAYVQLKAGSITTEAELLNFVRREVAERAAQPKYIRIVDAIPLTGVGKVYKPELKRREVRDALNDALREAGVAVDKLIVEDEKTQGTMIRVSLTDESQKAEALGVLGRFPFPCKIEALANA